MLWHVQLAQLELNCVDGYHDYFNSCISFMQMSSVDIYAFGPLEDSPDWEEICAKAMTLDKTDFLASWYPIHLSDDTLGS